MPGFELIGKEESKSIQKIFKNSNGILFRHGFDNLRNGNYFVNDFELKFKKKFKSKYSLAVTSGTAALRVALASIGIKANDEVITQSFTFVATVEAIVESGAKPICTEIDETLNMCPKDLLKKITKKTKAVILVHMLGSPGHVNEIKKICKKKKIILIEDTAWGIGAKYKNKFLGTIGDIGTFSFDFAKSITTGEGGMIIFKNKKIFNIAKAWHDHGHENNPNYPRWEDTRSSSGFNFRMNEMQGAVGLSQLKKFDQIFKLHKKNKYLIYNQIKNFKNIDFRKVPKGSFDASESLIFKFNNKSKSILFRKKLLQKGYSTKILPEAMTWHFAGYWSHIKSLKKSRIRDYKNSYDILSKCVALPVNINMDRSFPKIVKQVITSILKK
jgi:8-amino-3,8-dideoxy-alpha-D-manno-octulosonate transaminase